MLLDLRGLVLVYRRMLSVLPSSWHGIDRFTWYCLNILMYPGKFSRDRAKEQINTYLSATFPKHFERPPIA